MIAWKDAGGRLLGVLVIVPWAVLTALAVAFVGMGMGLHFLAGRLEDWPGPRWLR